MSKVDDALKDVSNSIHQKHQKHFSDVKGASEQNPNTDAFITDIDSEDKCSPLWAADYVTSMYKYYRSVEHPIPAQRNQSEVTARSRAILVSWLIEVHKKSELENQTLHLIVQIVDRFLGVTKEIKLDYLQLVGLGALLIGTKYEETWHFSIAELAAFCANAYEEYQILEVETKMLKALDYRLTVPNSSTFIVRFIKVACKDMVDGIAAFTTLSNYILEVTLLSYTLNEKYLPSEIAAMSVFVARKCMNSGCKSYLIGHLWPKILWYHTGYSERRLEQIAVEFVNEKKNIDVWGLKALKKKYNVTVFDKVLQLARV